MFVLERTKNNEEFLKEIEEDFNRYILYSNTNEGYVFSNKFYKRIINKFGEKDRFIKKENPKKSEYSLVAIEKQLSVLFCFHKRFEKNFNFLIVNELGQNGIEVKQHINKSKGFSKYFEYYTEDKVFFAVRISNHTNILCNNEYNFIVGKNEDFSKFIKKCKKDLIKKLITIKETNLKYLKSNF